jgi:hypothetical protein
MSDPKRDARRIIVEAANRHILNGRRSEPLNVRQINEAVAVVRHNRLVKPDVLVAAGFKASGRKAPNRTLVQTVKQRREIAVGGAWEHPTGTTSGEIDPPRPRRRSWFGRRGTKS